MKIIRLANNKTSNLTVMGYFSKMRRHRRIRMIQNVHILQGS